jgi:hypothetical protein
MYASFRPIFARTAPVFMGGPKGWLEAIAAITPDKEKKGPDMKATNATTPVPADVDARETFDLIAADKVEGTTVYTRAGDKLGSVGNVMIDKISGRVAYAVMSFGGFLGTGKDHYPLPWGALRYDRGMNGYVVDLDPEVLKRAPSYEQADTVDWADESWNRRLHDYYGVPPYWF